MTAISDLMQRHVDNMAMIEQRDRDSALSLSVLHNMILYDTAAFQVARKGNEALAAVLNKHAATVFEVIRGVQQPQQPQPPSE